MKVFGNRLIALIVAAGLLPIFIGCGGGPSNSPSASGNSDGSNATASAGESSLSAANPNAENGSMTVIKDGVQTEPAQCVAIFLDSLRSGNKDAANGVLTTKAQSELAKTSYEMEPLGTPQGQFQIGRAVFPYEDKTVALVECIWTEPETPEQPAIQMDIVCEVHQDPEGWGIAGLGITIPGTEETLVLDFENAAALQSAIDAATGRTAAQSTPETAVASETNSTQAVPAQMVSGPSQLPSGNGFDLPQGSAGQASGQANPYRQYEPTGGSLPSPSYNGGNQLRPSQPADSQPSSATSGQQATSPAAAGSFPAFPTYPGNGGQTP